MSGRGTAAFWISFCVCVCVCVCVCMCAICLNCRNGLIHVVTYSYIYRNSQGIQTPFACVSVCMVMV